MRRCWITSLALVAVCGLSACSNDDAGPSKADSLFADLTFDQACTKAKQDGKVVMVDFLATWCGPCKMLDKQTWPDAAVGKWLRENTIPIKIDIDQHRKIAQRFNIRDIPVLLFAKPDGTELGRITGFRPPKEFLKRAVDVLAGINPADRLKEELAAVGGNDPMKRQSLGKELARQGKHAEALKHYLWCFDHGNEHHLGYAGVRLSFLLSDISRLGRDYPPALAALRERRDRAAEAVLGGTGTFQNAMEVGALNSELGENDRTLAVYDQLAKANSPRNQELLQAMFSEVLDLLLAAKRYQDVVDGLGDVEETIDHRIAMYRYTAELYKGAPDSPAAFERRWVVEEGGKHYEALLGTDMDATAAKLADRLVKFDTTGETIAKLIRHAVRAGKAATARAAAEEWAKTLTPDQRELVLRAIERIP